MTLIYLIRHAKPLLPPTSLCLGCRSNPPLSPWGQRQAERLAAYLATQGIRQIYSSPLERCLATAKPLTRRLDTEISICPDLREIDMGSWDGLPFATIRERYPAAYQKRGEQFADFCTPGGESLRMALARSQAALANLASQTTAPLLVFSHGGIIRALRASSSGALEQALDFASPPYASISCFDYTHGQWQALAYAQMATAYPSLEECQAILQEYATPAPVIEHCQAVAQQAAILGRALQEQGVVLDLDLLQAAAWLHDIARDEKNHAERAYRLLCQWGYPQLATIIRQHHDLGTCHPLLNETTLLFYADKIIQGKQLVRLEQRFAQSRTKCHNAAALANHQKQFAQALAIEQVLKQYLGTLPGEHV